MTGSNTCKSTHTHHHRQQQRQQQQHQPLIQQSNQQTTTSAGREKHTVHWFRKGLRLHDNPAFARGVEGSKTFRCIFIIDPWFAGSSNVGINKWRFLLQCLEDLDNSLKNLNSRLFVIRGQPADALPKLFKKWGTTCFSFEEDPEPFGKVRDQNIQQLCNELNIDVIQAVSHTLFNLESIIERNGGHAPLTYNQFQSIVAAMDTPVMPEPVISQEHIAKSTTPTGVDHNDKFGVPTLLELGFDTDNLQPPIWIGGETEALARLERHLERKAWVASFGKPKMTPQSLLASQTGLSPYLRFGCLSTRLFYHQLTDLYKKIKKTCPPLSLHGQLLWREFFYCAATKNSNFDKMERNPICVQIPWQRNPTALAKWANGHTGFPWIDAIMTQLRYEGWIHHLARHAVACFLTRGDLWISWEEGMKVFEELLLDADWSVNAGTWMWLSCSSFFQQFFHCYCPVKFGRKADPNGDYIRRYLPVLKNFPIAYIHEPWHAPEDVQRTAKCIIGRDYPLPIVNHVNASRTNMKRLKQVYNQLSNYQKEETTVSVQAQRFTVNMSTPSPNTIISNVNNSGQFMCQMNKNSLHPSTTLSSFQHTTPHQHSLHPQYQRPIQPNQDQPSVIQLHSLQQSTSLEDSFTYIHTENPQLYRENCLPKVDYIEMQYKAPPLIAIEYQSIPSVPFNQFILHRSGVDTATDMSGTAGQTVLRPTLNPEHMAKYEPAVTTSIELQPYNGDISTRLATGNNVEIQHQQLIPVQQYHHHLHHQYHLQDQQQLMQQLNLSPASHQRQQYLNQRLLQQTPQEQQPQHHQLLQQYQQQPQQQLLLQHHQHQLHHQQQSMLQPITSIATLHASHCPQLPHLRQQQLSPSQLQQLQQTQRNAHAQTMKSNAATNQRDLHQQQLQSIRMKQHQNLQHDEKQHSMLMTDHLKQECQQSTDTLGSPHHLRNVTLYFVTAAHTSDQSYETGKTSNATDSMPEMVQSQLAKDNAQPINLDANDCTGNDDNKDKI